MPELPEVETVRIGLEEAMSGRLIASVEVRRADLRWPLPPDLATRLEGNRVLGARRRGKFILVDLSSGDTLIAHLGMTGRFRIGGSEADAGRNSIDPLEKHEHIVIRTGCGLRIGYWDPRRFGMMDLVRTASAEAHRQLRNLGPEPLGDGFTAKYLRKALAGSARPVKSALLDQSIVAGLGNIYACEALWLAGVSPTARSRSAADCAAGLAEAIKSVLSEAIDAGGSSLRDFRGVGGEEGYFQHDFKVYSREGEPCRNRDCPGEVARIAQSGRSTFYCRSCQL